MVVSYEHGFPEFEICNKCKGTGKVFTWFPYIIFGIAIIIAIISFYIKR